jgi:hypothetical protein
MTMSNQSRLCQVLYRDYLKYCQQIGITPENRPLFLITKSELLNTFQDYLISFPELIKINRQLRKVSGKYFRFGDLKIIYLDTETKFRILDGGGEKTIVTYQDLVRTMVHELVHCRFNLAHGREFNSKVKEILEGKSFPNMYSTN